MRSRIMYLAVMGFCTLAIAQFNAATVYGESILTCSPTTPTVDGADIANLANGVFIDDGSFRDVYDTKPTQGQTFMTGNNALGYDLYAITLQNSWGWDQGVNKYIFAQVGTVSGTTLTPIYTTTTNALTFIGKGDYVTVTFDASVHLNADTLYGFDWSSATSGGGRGFITMNTMTDQYTGGGAYKSGANSAPDNANLVFNPSQDRIFHLDMAAVPEPGTLALLATGLLGLLCYAWRKRR